ncbi:SDR family oxidoreductase [Cohnella cholangitidis]|uniref:SDR family oxidoreductase n=1 Tax=Cohnella cholangitidis TaxID=2598458 RepID=A0A7G5C7I4_9BACL|nr:SDR family oxidoreductase [Cohnella cholangitidis]QMV45168.1 SDR family oxidoreductase [Cohnella cholangitidis]
MDLFDLSGKTAVIIGGNSTLGTAMGEVLGAYGAKVAVVGRNAENSVAAKSRIQNVGGEAEVFTADATSNEDLERILSEIVSWSGGVDILFNCPGKNSATPFFEITEEEWDSIMDVNLKSVMLACQVFGKQMIDQGKGGSIVNISSVSSGPPLSRVFTYSASKAGVNSVTQFLARELAPHRIRVNGIIPGFFPAEQNKKILSEERIKSIMGHTPMNRFGTPEELQGAAIYLASEKASGFVTGTFLRVDGGFGAMTI